MARAGRLSNNKKRQISMLVTQASRALLAHKLDVCEQLCAKIDRIQPENPDAANFRGIISAESGDLAAAEVFFVQAVNTAPRRPEFHDNLGKLYLGQKLYADAVERYRSAMHYNSTSLKVKLGYCNALIGMGESEQALAVLEPLRSKYPKDVEVAMQFASACYYLNRIDEALDCLDAVLDRHPDHFQALYQRAQLFMQLGRVQEAEVEIRAALALQPEDVDACILLSGMKKYQRADDADIAALTSLYEKSAPETMDRLCLCFALGKVHDDLKLFDKAFAYYEEGNAIRHRNIAYNLDAELSHLQAVMSSYTPEVLQRPSDLDDERPIFIVGMPRCGSTLVEQILAAHPNVTSCGEWNGIDIVLTRQHSLENPLTLEAITEYTSEQWREIGQAYLDCLGNDSAQRMTDKSLINFRLIGAIHCALPKARIVHVRRNPMDNCLSLFMANLEGSQFDFSYSLGQIGYFYRMYQQVMKHWRRILPAGVLYELDYEQLVAEQETETRKLLAACGLSWDDRCLQFHKTKNRVTTSSVAQVRRSMYNDSVARWKGYEKHLQPLKRILNIS